ncbi:MAG: MFS transporter [Planctomycetia bacterium]
MRLQLFVQLSQSIRDRLRSLQPRGALRRDLWVSAADAAAFSVMVGCGETYIPAFALAVGLGPVAAGMLASVPVLVGALVQLVTPLAVARLGTNRGWCVACTTVQSLSFVPFVVWAIRGHAGLWELLAAASVYWSAGMAGGPAWNTWIGTVVPERMRTAFFAHRNRLGQFGVFVGFVAGGIALQVGEAHGMTLLAFAAIFAVAAICRLVSTLLLASCREMQPPERTSAEGMPSIVGRVRRAIGTIAASPSGRLVAYTCALSFSAHFSASYFTPYMLRERGFSYHAFMLVIATQFLAKAIALPWLGRLGSRIGSLGLLHLGGLSVIPLASLWLVSANVWFLMGVQFVAGCCWAAYELALALLFFDAVPHRERTAVVTAYNLGIAVATVAGAAAGGLLLEALGEDRTAYYALFVISSLLRVATIPLLRGVRVLPNHA